MAQEILMPKLGMTMEEGELTEWFKREGDEVEQGDPIFEVMTDKINIEVEATTSGVLLKTLAKEGEIVPVNQVVAYIGESGETMDPASSSRETSAQDENDTQQTASNGESNGQPSPADTAGKTEKTNASAPRSTKLLRATPSARRLARIHGIDLQTVQGSGRRGRIQALDVEKAVEQKKRTTELPKQVVSAQLETGGREQPKRQAEKQQGIHPQQEVAPVVDHEDIPFKGIRKVIGERMVQSVQQAPHVTLNRWVTMDAAHRFKAEWEDAVREETGHKLSLNDLFILAIARALKHHPQLNASLEGNFIRQYRDIHVGVAVQTDYGLVVPVLHKVNLLPLGEVVKQLRKNIEKAHNRELSTESATGGTFTISNLGGYDIETFTPIINQPQAAILGVGKMTVQPEWNGETWQPVKKLPLSLSFDHRLIDGAPAAEFLQTVTRYLQEPRKLLI